MYYFTVSDSCTQVVDSVYLDYQFSVSYAWFLTHDFCNDSTGLVEAQINSPSLLDSMYLQNTATQELYFPDLANKYTLLSGGDYALVLVDTFGCTQIDSFQIQVADGYLSGDKIGKITIFDKVSYVAVQNGVAKLAMKALTGLTSLYANF